MQSPLTFCTLLETLSSEPIGMAGSAVDSDFGAVVVAFVVVVVAAVVVVGHLSQARPHGSVTVCPALNWQAWPPDSAGLITTNVFVTTPTPHVTEHFPNWVNAPTQSFVRAGAGATHLHNFRAIGVVCVAQDAYRSELAKPKNGVVSLLQQSPPSNRGDSPVSLTLKQLALLFPGSQYPSPTRLMLAHGRQTSQDEAQLVKNSRTCTSEKPKVTTLCRQLANEFRSHVIVLPPIVDCQFGVSLHSQESSSHSFTMVFSPQRPHA